MGSLLAVGSWSSWWSSDSELEKVWPACRILGCDACSACMYGVEAGVTGWRSDGVTGVAVPSLPLKKMMWGERAREIWWWLLALQGGYVRCLVFPRPRWVVTANTSKTGIVLWRREVTMMSSSNSSSSLSSEVAILETLQLARRGSREKLAWLEAPPSLVSTLVILAGWSSAAADWHWPAADDPFWGSSGCGLWTEDRNVGLCCRATTHQTERSSSKAQMGPVAAW